MKKQILFTLIILLASCSIVLAKDGKTYGEKLTLADETALTEVIQSPEEFLGQKVKVSGKVVGVCDTRGCWIDLATDDNQTMRVKVDDGVIVFPMDAKGHNAVVEGEVYKLEFDADGNLLAQSAKTLNCAEHGREHAAAPAPGGEKKAADAKSGCSKEQQAKCAQTQKEKDGCASHKNTAEGDEPELKEPVKEVKTEVAKVVYQIKGHGAVIN